MPDNCPRCEHAIVTKHGDFACGKCGYTLKDWVEDRFQAQVEEIDISIHEQIADSPALAFDWEDFEARR